MYCRGLENAIAHFLRRFDVRIDGRDDADENPLTGLHVLPDDLEHVYAILLTGEGDVEVARPSIRNRLGSSSA